MVRVAGAQTLEALPAFVQGLTDDLSDVVYSFLILAALEIGKNFSKNCFFFSFHVVTELVRRK